MFLWSKRLKYILLTMITLVMSDLALADDCGNAGPQMAMNQCTADQYAAADQKLNKTYQAVLKRAESPQRELLKKAQLAWMESRDADCELLISGNEHGSVRPMIHNLCLTDKTNEREAFLSVLLQCEVGNLSCPLSSANAN